MPQFAADSTGHRIKTDILVCVYMRENGQKCRLLIPVDVNKICFQFWLINVCDEWDKKYLSEEVELDGQIIKQIKDLTHEPILYLMYLSVSMYLRVFQCIHVSGCIVYRYGKNERILTQQPTPLNNLEI